MKRLVFWLHVLVMTGMTVLSAAAAAESATTSLEAAFRAANEQVAQGHFAEGASNYARLPTANATSVALEYNRGLAYARAGELGLARAHLLLAERLAPREPTIQAALNQLASRWPASASSDTSGAWAWTDRLTLNEWGQLALVSAWVWGVLAVLMRVRPGLAGALRGYVWGTGFLALVMLTLVLTSWNRRSHSPNAVVIQSEAPVLVSPVPEARAAFALAEGARVFSEPARPGWVKVVDPANRRFGWVQEREIVQLPLR